MKLGIVTDVHLFHKNSQIKLFHKIINELQNQVSMIIDCGDLIDTNTISADQTKELFNIFSNVKIPYHIVRGNHDTINDTSVASLLPMNKNIFVHNDIEVCDNFLFVPYFSDTKKLIEKLNDLHLSESLKFAFSHLNITENFYATIPISNCKFLHLYADTWINGHIHTPESSTSIYGSIYNIGSFSSLSFNDEHIPTYIILDTDTGKLNYNSVLGSRIHKTFNVSDDIITFITEHDNNIIDVRIKIPINFSLEEKQNLKVKLQSLHNVSSIQFDYVKVEQQTQEKFIEPDNNEIKYDVNTLLTQLIQQYERDCKDTVSQTIKKELSNFD